MGNNWADAIASLKSPSPLLRQWAREASQQSDVLDLMLATLTRAGAIQDASEMLPYLDDLLTHERGHAGHVTWSDIDGLTVWRGFANKLRRHLGDDTSPSSDLYLAHGSIGHLAIPDLFMRSFGDETLHRAVSPQLKFVFTNGIGQSLPFPFVDDALPYEPQYEQCRIDMRRVMTRARRFWNTHRHTFGNLKNGDRAAFAQKLRSVLAPIFGTYMERLDAHPNRDERITLMTLMSWASALSMCLQSPERIFFTEVALSDPTNGFTGGRLDALELEKIGGKRPTAQQRAHLRLLASQRYRSSGRLLRALETLSPRRLELNVIDWKFAIGDAGAGQMLDLASIRETPDKKHYAQVSRYLSLLLFDRALLSGRARPDVHVWEQSRHRVRGTLAYFFPNTRPIVHEVQLHHDDLQEVFDEQIALRYQLGQERSSLRNVTRLIDRHIEEVIGVRTPRITSTVGQSQDSLFPARSHAAAGFIAQARRRHYEPCDEHEILWHVRPRKNGGKERFELRLDALVEAIESGRVSVGSFDLVEGGTIGCLMPSHIERTPSFHIYLDDGLPRFFCFGCGVRGFIPKNTIPESIILAPRERRIPGWKKSELPVIPSDHHDALSLAQVLLSSHFKGSLGEAYLHDTRGIDPEIAYAHGAGFVSDRFIPNMMDAGYSLDDLREMGLVSYASTIGERGGIVPLLKKRGMAVEEMRRMCKPPLSREKGLKVSHKKVWGLPYCTLANRVTFPLCLEGRNTSFYGRAIHANMYLKHYKTKRPPHVPQGGFNMQALTEAHDEIIVCEAAIDALTLMMLGKRNVCALIGVVNRITAAAIARGGKPIAMALDRDIVSHTGEKKTWEMAEMIAERGIAVRDFTGAFLEKLSTQERESFKDFNQWWTGGGCVRTALEQL